MIRKLANNAGAQFSDQGFSTIVARAGADDELVEILGLRADLPQHSWPTCCAAPRTAVRARLLAIAPPAVQEEIKRVLNEIAREAPPPGRSFGVAEEYVKLMKGLNELDDAAVYNFAESKKFDEVTVAIAVLNEMPIEMMARLMEGPRADLILIPCRSARLNWPTVESILRNRPVMPSGQRARRWRSRSAITGNCRWRRPSAPCDSGSFTTGSRSSRRGRIERTRARSTDVFDGLDLASLHGGN